MGEVGQQKWTRSETGVGCSAALRQMPRLDRPQSGKSWGGTPATHCKSAPTKDFSKKTWLDLFILFPRLLTYYIHTPQDQLPPLCSFFGTPYEMVETTGLRVSLLLVRTSHNATTALHYRKPRLPKVPLGWASHVHCANTRGASRDSTLSNRHISLSLPLDDARGSNCSLHRSIDFCQVWHGCGPVICLFGLSHSYSCRVFFSCSYSI